MLVWSGRSQRAPGRGAWRNQGGGAELARPEQRVSANPFVSSSSHRPVSGRRQRLSTSLRAARKVLIDEAAQATELATVVPLCHGLSDGTGLEASASLWPPWHLPGSAGEAIKQVQHMPRFVRRRR